MRIHQMEDIQQLLYPLRHYDQEEGQTDGSRHWDTMSPTLVRAFAREEARDFDDEYWLMLIHEGSNKMRTEYCEVSNGSLSYLQAVQGNCGGIPISPKLMNYTLIPCNWKEHIYHRRISWNVQSIWGSGLIPGGSENDRARQSVFCTALNPFGQDTEEEPRSFDYSGPQKNNTMRHIGNAIKMRYFM